MKTVMVFGTFDFLHAGHFHLFAQASKLGDELIVVIARDHRATLVKGKEPIHSEKERRDLVSHVDYVHKAVLGGKKDVYAVIKEYHPDVIALGYDQQVFTEGIEMYVKKHHLSTRIVRLKPYKNATHKSSVIKSRLVL